MKRGPLTIEYKVGRIELKPNNLLVRDITDMETLEFWEDRLKSHGQSFAVAFREVNGVINYYIYTDLRKNKSIFRT